MTSTNSDIDFEKNSFNPFNSNSTLANNLSDSEFDVLMKISKIFM